MKRTGTAALAAAAVLTAITAGGAALAAAGRAPEPVAVGWQQAGCPMGSMQRIVVSDEAAYLAEMVAHHQEAVAAAGQLRRSPRAEMRALGASIVKTQSAEIATMKSWLATWYPGRKAAPYRPMMRDLSKLSGDALDEAFLQDMIPHHMIAVMMSQQLLMHGGIQHEEVAEFAGAVRDSQHAEMFRMQRYLADWFGSGWRMPCGPSWDGPGNWPGGSAPSPSPQPGSPWMPGGMMGW
ncbi:DUF305 domain-containing protein [Nonomuraea sp. SMC257]|uniref:DUF305 domain-containing protein n=1 Tax=Nonomuraea montanisoli TaxID=2741721 RepID=A0A7Y6M1E4_9ACTN|nr:DUF305 domain-containing protein [Nonomuraea montanisoli]NUW30335.1 DUF305 domain-containing protein [Nonomuraea montanisoli]